MGGRATLGHTTTTTVVTRRLLDPEENIARYDENVNVVPVPLVAAIVPEMTQFAVAKEVSTDNDVNSR